MKEIIISILAVCFLIGCGKSSSLYGKLGTSNSIEESKTREVFLFEYRPSSYKLNFNDSLHVEIVDVWVEKVWRYDYPFNKTLIGDGGYRIIISLKEGSWKEHYKKSWFLGTDYDFNFTPKGEKKLVSNIFDTVPLDYTMIKIQKEDRVSNEQVHQEILGKLTFTRK